MRPIRHAAVVLALSATTLSAAAAQEHQHAPAKGEKERPAAGHSMEHMSGWKELDAYHMVMIQVWHPAKEKNDLAPIRAQAMKLAEAGNDLAKSSVPTACDTPANRVAVTKVQDDSRALAALVGTGADAEVLAALRVLHDRFETLNRGCKAGHH